MVTLMAGFGILMSIHTHRKMAPGMDNSPSTAIIAAMIMLPTALIAIQPDLGTAVLIGAAGFLVLVLAGLSIRLMAVLGLLSIPGAMVLWNYVMADYQKQRVLTLLNPDSDPLGAGYNIIQSKIAIGSGGLFGKGWTNGSQAQLEFLPERQTDTGP